ncbi:MAG TPA: hypothetical protein VMV31_06420 [Terriglobales bacterium]|nr:hypothetical protein [Terriglobales bacterium]
MESDRRTSLYVGLIFVSGLLLGGTLMNLAEHYWLHAHTANEYDIRQHRLIAAKMSQRLHLSPQQQSQVDAILQQTVGQYQQLEQRLAPQFDQLRQQDRDHLRAILNPQQRVEFDTIVREVDAEYPLNERPAVLSPVPCESAATAVAHP